MEDFIATLLRGLGLALQAWVIGGIVFAAAVARPLAPKDETRRTLRLVCLGALALAAVRLAATVLLLTQLMRDMELGPTQVLGAGAAGGWAAVLALGIAALCRARLGLRRPEALLVPAALLVAVAVTSSHAWSRLEGRGPLLAAEFLHQWGAGMWIGGIPFLLAALARAQGSELRQAITQRFSRVAMTAVAALLAGAAVLMVRYLDSPAQLIGTDFGAMAMVKAAFLAVMLLMGLANLLAGRRLARSERLLMRLRRFAEVEIGIGIGVLFIAASLASQPLPSDQAGPILSPADIAQRYAPQWPRFLAPVPGTAETGSRAEGDEAWSEMTHHWSGLVVLAMGVLGAVRRMPGGGWARHWPLLFLVIAGGIPVLSDPDSWPLGPYGFFGRPGDAEVVQHRVFSLLVAAFGLFEWRVQTGRATGRAALVFPLLCALGSTLLLVHGHQIGDTHERLLIHLSHMMIGVFGALAGWSRWLELRGEGWPRTLGGWAWPVCFILVGIVLLDYREA